MAKTVIALHPLRGLPIPGPSEGNAPGAVADPRGRALRDLRISVTDRCNFRCTYCMPREVFDAHYEFLPHSEILTFEEIVRMARVFSGLGTEKIRLTGGEPLLRKDIERLVAMLREALPSVDLTLTTNGWRMEEVVPSAEVVYHISEQFPIEPMERDYSSEVAERWRYRDGAGEFGVISSVTHAFCSTCSRARLSTDGQLYTCLFAQSGYDLKSMMRSGRSDEEIAQAVAAIWRKREDRYSEIRTAETAHARKIEMSYIGG